MVKTYVVYGSGIGCHNECIYAYQKAGAQTELIHINQLLRGEISVFDAQILNLAGGFLHGDKLGTAMCAANELERASAVIRGDDEERVKDTLIEFAERGYVITGQCNGFQALVKMGLLPGINKDYSKQTVTLTGNVCGNYRVGFAPHKLERKHFAFEGIDDPVFYISCRHGEGRILFSSEHGLVTKEEGEEARRIVNEKHVLLRYANPITKEATSEFPYCPNGSTDGIAGMVNETGTIFGHMCHTEVHVDRSRDPEFWKWKDRMRRLGVKAAEIDEKRLEDIGLRVFKNIVDHFK